MLEKLKADATDDLYFAGGRDRLIFRNLLASGHLPQALLARCVDLSPSALGGAAPATVMWRAFLTDERTSAVALGVGTSATFTASSHRTCTE